MHRPIKYSKSRTNEIRRADGTVIALEDTDNITIDGREYSVKTMRKVINHSRNMQIHSGDGECPLCGCEFEEIDKFVCDRCGKLLSTDDRHGDQDICEDCWDDYSMDQYMPEPDMEEKYINEE